MTDGSVIQETPEDKSNTTEGRNAFYDVIQRIGEVKRFSLRNCVTDAGDTSTVSVDLTDGTFTMNGSQPFTVQNPSVELDNNPEYRLIYFRRVWQHRHMDGTQSSDMEFHIGWQVTTEGGKNVKYTIAVR
jgi:hypothetical protein